jgi:hypothetical protein
MVPKISSVRGPVCVKPGSGPGEQPFEPEFEPDWGEPPSREPLPIEPDPSPDYQDVPPVRIIDEVEETNQCNRSPRYAGP